jgi:DivIVA domain-containing protein
VLLVAGSTGLAPVKAIAEQIAELPHPPQVHLFFGARHAEGLYDVADLEKFSASAPWLTVTACVSDDPDYRGERGLLPDVVGRHGSVPGRAHAHGGGHGGPAGRAGSPARPDSPLRLRLERAMTAFLGFGGRLTPEAVQEVSFPPARIGRRGLDDRHVRAFCGQVERELVRLLHERASLSNEVQRLRDRLLGGEGAGARALQDDAQVLAVRVLSTAQQTAERYVADAQEYSRQLADDAR